LIAPHLVELAGAAGITSFHTRPSAGKQTQALRALRNSSLTS
jgi:hypothetical protein